jgi:hypothetical protein
MARRAKPRSSRRPRACMRASARSRHGANRWRAALPSNRQAGRSALAAVGAIRSRSARSPPSTAVCVEVSLPGFLPSEAVPVRTPRRRLALYRRPATLYECVRVDWALRAGARSQGVESGVPPPLIFYGPLGVPPRVGANSAECASVYYPLLHVSPPARYPLMHVISCAATTQRVPRRRPGRSPGGRRRDDLSCVEYKGSSSHGGALPPPGPLLPV